MKLYKATLKLVYLKVEVMSELASALDQFSSGNVTKAIETTKKALELMKSYERMLKEVGR